MTAFYVGQRIKKVRGHATNIGLTGLVVAVGYVHHYTPEATILVRIDRDAVGDVVDYRAGDAAPSIPSEWEPIAPPGLESIEEINALYEPSQVPA